MIYINPYLSMPINTIIGGIGATTNTIAKLAILLAIPESQIARFELSGLDVNCHILGIYQIPGSCFASNTAITSYLDLNGNVSLIGSAAFQTSSNLVNAFFPNAGFLGLNNFRDCISFTNALYGGVYSTTTTSLNDTFGAASFRNTRFKSFIAPNLTYIGSRSQLFQLCSNLELIDMKRLSTFGNDPSVTLNTFTSLKLNCVINVNVALKTSNSGSPDASLVWVKANRSATVNFFNNDLTFNSTL